MKIKIPILLIICIIGSAHCLPTFRELYASARNAIGFKTPAEKQEIIDQNIEVSEIPLSIKFPEPAEEEVTTSKYSFSAAVDKAKSYIPSASSLVPRLSYKDGTLTYSWAIFHMSGGVHRPTTTVTPETISDTMDTHTVSSNQIPRFTTEETIVEEINTGDLRSTEHDFDSRSREIFLSPRFGYDEDFPPLPEIEDGGIEIRETTEPRVHRAEDTPILKDAIKDNVLEKIVRSSNVNTDTNQDVDFWRAEYYLGKKLGRPFFKYMMDNDLL